MASLEKSSITGALATATCSLLGTSLPEAVQAQEEPGWEFDSALLYYGEDDDRVQDFSLSILGQRFFVDDRILSLGITVDALTGASPNGALPQGFAQTFTQPSGKKTYSIDAGELPIDDTFRDTRLALTANWQQPLSRLYTANIGLSASREYDYTHFGVNGKLSRDFNQRNTTLSAGLSFARDRIDPVGEVPAGLTPMLNVDDLSNRDGHETKTVIDAVLGVSQVISRNLVMQLNYSYSSASGYLTDPYKHVSVVDSVSGEAIELVPTPDVAGPSHLYLFELRPDERTKHSLFGQAKYYMDGKILDLSYRYMTDDWEIDSHTLDMRLRWPVSKRSFIEPHLRYYSQSAADFYALSINEAEPLPRYVSADYRLGDFDAVTAGLKYGWQSRNGNDRSVRLELYRQSSNISSADLLGNQAQQDNVPDLNAVILQFGYRFGR